MLPPLDEHFSPNVDSVYSKNVNATTFREIIILHRIFICFEFSLCCASKCTLVQVWAACVALLLLHEPILLIVHRYVLVKSTVLWLVVRDMVSNGVKS